MSSLSFRPTVTVVIPAYNAQSTLDETVLSVRLQTYPNLEIWVVDDGSTDDTCEVVSRHLRMDARVRLIRQENAGVAAARNAGAAAGSGEFIAPIDADDLWHPTKIARQLAVFTDGPRDLGLVYTWYALIDAQSNIIHTRHSPSYTGSVLPILARYNFIGNGSSSMIRMSTFKQSPQYDPSLRARGAQGVEDWKLYCQLAAMSSFGVVEAALTGYRLLSDNMSSDPLRMLRSKDLAIEDIVVEHSELASALRKGRNRLSRHYLYRAIEQRRWGQIRAVLTAMLRYDYFFMLRTLADLPRFFLRSVRNNWAGHSTGTRRQPFLLSSGYLSNLTGKVVTEEVELRDQVDTELVSATETR